MLFDMRIENDKFIFDGVDNDYVIKLDKEDVLKLKELFSEHPVFRYIDFASFKENAEQDIQQQFYINEEFSNEFMEILAQQDFIEIKQK